MDGCFTLQGAVTVLLGIVVIPIAYVWLETGRWIRNLRNFVFSRHWGEIFKALLVRFIFPKQSLLKQTAQDFYL